MKEALRLYWQCRNPIAFGLGGVAANLVWAWYIWPAESAVVNIAAASGLLVFTLMAPFLTEAQAERDWLRIAWSKSERTEQEFKSMLQTMIRDVTADMKRHGELPDRIQINLGEVEEDPPGRLH